MLSTIEIDLLQNAPGCGTSLVILSSLTPTLLLVLVLLRWRSRHRRRWHMRGAPGMSRERAAQPPMQRGSQCQARLFVQGPSAARGGAGGAVGEAGCAPEVPPQLAGCLGSTPTTMVSSSTVVQQQRRQQHLEG